MFCLSSKIPSAEMLEALEVLRFLSNFIRAAFSFSHKGGKKKVG